jgi:hypothetical protein
MVEITIEIPPRLKVLLNPQSYQRALDRALLASGKEVLKIAAKEPGPSVQPVEWKSEKQRRFYFAMRREWGLPPKYTRSSRLRTSWVARRNDATSLIVAPTARYAMFVQGNWQQPFHRNTGWITDRQIKTEFIDSGKLTQILNDSVRQEMG